MGCGLVGCMLRVKVGCWGRCGDGCGGCDGCGDCWGKYGGFGHNGLLTNQCNTEQMLKLDWPVALINGLGTELYHPWHG